jgi:predicted Fe-Mo cluster-binding NifX family protein
MTKIAIPIFHERISPVLDSCKRLLIIDVEHGREQERMEIFLDDLSLTDRCQFIRKIKVNVLICCGISDILDTMLQSAGVRLICGIVGNVEQVVSAFLNDRLNDPCFHMPADMHPSPDPTGG